MKKKLLTKLIILSLLLPHSLLPLTYTYAAETEKINNQANSSLEEVPYNSKIELLDNTESRNTDLNENNNWGIQLDTLRIHKKEINISESTDITLNTTEDKNVNKVNLIFKHGESDKVKKVRLDSDKDTYIFSGTFEISNDTEEGSWKLSEMLIQDFDGNVKKILNTDAERDNPSNSSLDTYNWENMNILVSVPEEEPVLKSKELSYDYHNLNKDNLPPVIDVSSILVNKSILEYGEYLEFSVEVSDIDTPQLTVNTEYINDEGDRIFIHLYNVEGNLYKGDRLISNSDNGNWYLERITVFEGDGTAHTGGGHKVSAFNNRYESGKNSYDFSQHEFEVIGPIKEDSQVDDLFCDFEVSNHRYEDGEEVEISVKRKFRNNIPKIDLVLSDEYTRNHYTVTLLWNQENQSYQGTFIDEDSMGSSKYWKPHSIYWEYLELGYSNLPVKNIMHVYFENPDDYESFFFGKNILPVIKVQDIVKVKIGEKRNLFEYFEVFDYYDGEITFMSSVEANNINWNERGYYSVKVSAINSEGLKNTREFLINIIDPKIKSINIDIPRKANTLQVGEKQQLSTYLQTIDIEDDIDYSVTWSSSNSGVMTVSSSGEILAVNSGLAVITARYENHIDKVLFEVRGGENDLPLIMNENKTIINRILYSDIYIARGTDIRFSNVTVHGDIYVDGKLTLTSSEINGRIFVDETIKSDNDENQLSSSILIEDGISLIVKGVDKFNRDESYLYLPEETISSINGKTYIMGKSLLPMQGYVDYYRDLNGLFYYTIENYSTLDTNQELQLNFWGDTIKKTIPINNFETIEDNRLNGIPRIETQEVINIPIGEKINYSELITATDFEDGNIFEKIIIDDSEVNLSERGYYTVYLSVTDSNGKTVEESFNVNVFNPKIDHVRVPSYTIEINKGQSRIISIDMSGSEGDIYYIDKEFEWKSSNEDVAIAEHYEQSMTHQKIQINALERGETTFSSIIDGKNYYFKVLVQDPQVFDFEIHPSDLYMNVGERKRINPINVDYQDFSRMPILSGGSVSDLITTEHYATSYFYVNSYAPGIIDLSVNMAGLSKIYPFYIIPDINYQAYTPTDRWQTLKKNGETSGTTDQKQPIKSMKIGIENYQNLNIELSMYTNKNGWSDWKDGNKSEVINNVDEQLEAFRLRLTGDEANHYDIYYRAYSQSYGWLDWAKSGEISGTVGMDKRLEAYEVKLLPKIAEFNQSTKMPSVINNSLLSYTTHVEKYGWQKPVREGKVSGTYGEAKRLEGIIFNIDDTHLKGSIEYRTHVESYGWLDWVKEGELSGTEGEAKRLEAIQIRLSEELDKSYDVLYRVHAEKFGWLGWAKNGEEAGTAGFAYRLEAIEVKLIPKGQQYDTSVKPYYELSQNPQVSYTTHVQSFGWQDRVMNGSMSGTVGMSKRLEGIKIDVKNFPALNSGGIEYQTHVETYGWMKKVKNNALSGTTGESKRLEAIRMNLTGELEKHFDIYYRVHVEKLGWLDWAKNGESSGTSGFAYRLEGIEIQLVRKNNRAPGNIEKSYINNIKTYN